MADQVAAPRAEETPGIPGQSAGATIPGLGQFDDRAIDTQRWNADLDRWRGGSRGRRRRGGWDRSRSGCEGRRRGGRRRGRWGQGHGWHRDGGDVVRHQITVLAHEPGIQCSVASIGHCRQEKDCPQRKQGVGQELSQPGALGPNQRCYDSSTLPAFGFHEKIIPAYRSGVNLTTLTSCWKYGKLMQTKGRGSNGE